MVRALNEVFVRTVTLYYRDACRVRSAVVRALGIAVIALGMGAAYLAFWGIVMVVVLAIIKIAFMVVFGG